MTYYRLYFLSPDDHISRFVELFHDTDQQALEGAREHVANQAMELWDHGRLVARISADGVIAQQAAASAQVAPA